MFNGVTVFNIREYLSVRDDKDLGEEELQELLSEFSCEKNPDVEKFLKQRSLEFTKKNQSVTYLVFWYIYAFCISDRSARQKLYGQSKRKSHRRTVF